MQELAGMTNKSVASLLWGLAGGTHSFAHIRCTVVIANSAWVFLRDAETRRLSLCAQCCQRRKPGYCWQEASRKLGRICSAKSQMATGACSNIANKFAVKSGGSGKKK